MDLKHQQVFSERAETLVKNSSAFPDHISYKLDGIGFAHTVTTSLICFQGNQIMNNQEEHHPNAHLVTVYTVGDAVKAELIRNALQEHGIRCELGGEHQAGFTGTFAVDVIVLETDRERAEKLIEDLFPAS